MKDTSTRNEVAVESVGVAVIIDSRVLAVEQIEADQLNFGVFADPVTELAIHGGGGIGAHGIIFPQRTWAKVA